MRGWWQIGMCEKETWGKGEKRLENLGNCENFGSSEKGPALWLGSDTCMAWGLENWEMKIWKGVSCKAKSDTCMAPRNANPKRVNSRLNLDTYLGTGKPEISSRSRVQHLFWALFSFHLLWRQSQHSSAFSSYWPKNVRNISQVTIIFHQCWS